MHNNSKQKLISFIASLMVTLVIIYYITKAIDWKEIIQVYHQANPVWIFGGFILTFFVYIPFALRWSFLLGQLEVKYHKLQSYRACLAGLFGGLILPGTLGGDAIRIGLCNRDTKANLVLITTSLFMEKTIGILSLTILIFLGIKLTGVNSQVSFLKYIPWLVVFGCLVLLLLPIIIRFLSKNKRFLNALNAHLPNIMWRLLAKLSPFKTVAISTFYLVLGYSMITQLIDVVATFCLAQGLGIHVSISMILIALPASYFAAAVPFSIGGLGVREGAFVVIFALFGMSLSQAIILAFVIFLNRAVVGLIGGIFAINDYISYQRIKKSASLIT